MPVSGQGRGKKDCRSMAQTLTLDRFKRYLSIDDQRAEALLDRDSLPPDLEPYVDPDLPLFGPTRLIVGGDWPVCLFCGAFQMQRTH